MSLSLALERIRQRPFEAQLLAEPLPLEGLPTPALVLDRPALERNLERMAQHMRQHGKGFRPHAKTHKCPLISAAQMEAGAVGVCAAKLGEAAALAQAGIERILLTSPVVTAAKAAVAAQISQQINGLMMVVDSMQGLEVLAEALSVDAPVTLLIDIDVAMGRTGTRDFDTVLALIDEIEQQPAMRFGGVQHYAGHLMHVADFAQRRSGSLALWEQVAQMLHRLQTRGIDCPVVTGGGTGTYDIDVAVDQVTDLQVGSYVFMDEEYREVQPASGDRFEFFEPSLTVACTAISQPKAGTITVDGGYKAFASDSVAPVCDDHPLVKFHFAGDEHGVLALGRGEQEVRLGQVLEFVVPHCDPTVNLHDYYWVREADGLIHSCWPITARGAAW